jgi:hypothetical protein
MLDPWRASAARGAAMLAALVLTALLTACDEDPEREFGIGLSAMPGQDLTIDDFNNDLKKNPVTKGVIGKRRTLSTKFEEHPAVIPTLFEDDGSLLDWMDRHDRDAFTNPEEDYEWFGAVCTLREYVGQPPDEVLGVTYEDYGNSPQTQDCCPSVVGYANIQYWANLHGYDVWPVLRHCCKHELGHQFCAAHHTEGDGYHCFHPGCVMFFELLAPRKSFCYDGDLETDNDCWPNLGRNVP